MEHKLSFVLKP